MPKEGSKANAKNSSKTARVLGLLTNPPAEAGDEPAELLPPEPEREVPRPPQPSDDRVVEAEVRGALEHELEGMMVEMQEEHNTEAFAPDNESPAAQPPEGAAPEQDGQEAAQEAEPAVEISEPVGPKSRLEPEIFCFNITQALVEAKADKYIDLFGLCKCDRCRIDVIALSLTNLPAKYVVARKNEMVPLLSVYEGKYNAAIVSQVMNACKMVMEHPRHNK